MWDHWLSTDEQCYKDGFEKKDQQCLETWTADSSEGECVIEPLSRKRATSKPLSYNKLSFIYQLNCQYQVNERITSF